MDISGWGMAECMNNVVLVAIKIAIQTTNHISISCDEVISIYNQSLILVHAYVVEDFKRTFILVNLEQVIKDYTIDNLTNMIQNSMKGFRDCMTMTWLLRFYALVQMVLPPSKASKLGLQPS
jgi:hypothetical protein